MSILLYRSMLSKVRALLKIELPHNAEDRKLQQWQLLFTIDGIQYVVGKGGVNTMFYQIGIANRKLCYPEELLQLLESFTRRKVSSYAICDPKGKVVLSGLMSEEDALKKKPKIGYFIVGFVDGKKVRLYVGQTGLFKPVWTPFQHKKSK